MERKNDFVHIVKEERERERERRKANNVDFEIEKAHPAIDAIYLAAYEIRTFVDPALEAKRLLEMISLKRSSMTLT